MKKNLYPQQVRLRRTIKKTGIAVLLALATLFSGIKIGQKQEKKKFENIIACRYALEDELTKRAEYFQKDAADLAIQNIELRRYASDAQTLAESMKFYPTEPDSLSALPEKEQEKAMQKFWQEDEKKRAEHADALKHLGVDTNLLFRVQKGPCLGE